MNKYQWERTHKVQRERNASLCNIEMKHIKERKIYNGKIEVVSFVIESGRKLTISEVYVKNVDKVPPCDYYNESVPSLKKIK